jgi:hypothetical protein
MRLVTSLGVIGIVLLLVGANIATAQLQPAIEVREIKWKEYNCRRYGWSMKYPSDWDVDKKGREIIFSSGYSFVSVYSFEPTKGKVLVDLTADAIEEELKENKNVSGLTRWKSTVGDYEAVGFSYTLRISEETSLKVKEWILAKDNKPFAITCAALPKYYEEQDSLYFIPMRVSFKIK